MIKDGRGHSGATTLVATARENKRMTRAPARKTRPASEEVKIFLAFLEKSS